MQYVATRPDFILGSYFTYEQVNGKWQVSFIWSAHLDMQLDLTEFRKIPDVHVTGMRITGHYSQQSRGDEAKVGLMSVPYSSRQPVEFGADFDVDLGTNIGTDNVLHVIASYVTKTWPVTDTERHYTQVAVSSIRLYVDYESDATPCGAPTSVALDKSVAESSAVLSWSGATGGHNNAVSYYDVEYRDSSDGASWGAWDGTRTASVQSMTVYPPSDRGGYRQFRVRAVGAAGVEFASVWKVLEDPLRKDVLPSKPSGIIIAQTVVEDDPVQVSWTAAAPGLLPVSGYRLEVQAGGGEWTLVVASTPGTSYNAPVPAVDRGDLICYRVRAIDSDGGISDWTVSSPIMKNRCPFPPVLLWPPEGSVCMAEKPFIAVRVDPEPDGQVMTIESQIGEGQWKESLLPMKLPFVLGHGIQSSEEELDPGSDVWDSGASVSGNGKTQFVFRLPSSLEDGKAYFVRLRLRDSLGAVSEYVALNIGRSSSGTWTRNIAHGRVISGPIVHHTDDLAELLNCVNARLAWFKSPPISYATPVGHFANWLPQMRQLWAVLSDLYRLGDEYPAEISQDDNYPTAATFNLIRSMCENL